MQYNPNAKIGRKFGDGIEWYPNLLSAIMNRNLSRIDKRTLEYFDFKQLLEHCRQVEYRYCRLMKSIRG
jgi:hypothetical protein